MKRYVYLLLILIAAVGLTACGSQQEEKKSDTDQNVEVEKSVDSKSDIEKADQEKAKKEDSEQENSMKDESAQEDSGKEKPAQEEPSKSESVQKDTVKKESSQNNVVKESSPVVTGNPAAEKQSKVYQNEAFKDVVVKETGDKISVTGKAQVFEGVIQYKLSEGDKVLKEDKYQTEGAPAWGDFNITFGKELISGNNANFKLFVYSAKDNSEINVLDIPIKK